ncbi:MAG: electron transport complex subunit RsxA [Gammaproteobacteria bacterium]|nr:electron transport complex subunit RsxA [Gammaproteobacteria bacterium]TVQ46695.1 MAG: electron transport complex subunit RsxA [Gammaproteobacteria bacterium]
MTELALIVIATVLVNNLVLVNFLGLCPFMGVTSSTTGTAGMALATAFVLTLAAAAGHLVYTWVLVPLELTWLRTLAFILVIAGLVQLTELVVRATSPLLYQVLGIYLPLITSNCLVLGVALINLTEAEGFVQAVVYGLGAAAGFALVMVLFAGLRERIDAAPVPVAFRGAGIALITAGMMSLAFLGFAGMGRG